MTEVLDHPQHRYTRELLEAIPSLTEPSGRAVCIYPQTAR